MEPCVGGKTVFQMMRGEYIPDRLDVMRRRVSAVHRMEAFSELGHSV